MEKYQIIAGPDKRDRVTVRRASDGWTARCKLGWLEPDEETEGLYEAKDKTKAIRMDDLEWRQKG